MRKMQTFAEFLTEGPVIDLEKKLISRVVDAYHKNLTPQGYKHSMTSKGPVTHYAWRKGQHHFEVVHDSRLSGQYQWGHAAVDPQTGKIKFFKSGRASTRGGAS